MSTHLGGIALAVALAVPSDAQHVLYATDFSDAAGWTFVGSGSVGWSVDALPKVPLAPFVSAPASLNFNDDTLGLPWGLWWGSAASPVIDIAVANQDVRLEFEYGFDHEVDCQWDAFSVLVLDAADPSLVRHEECLSATSFAFRAWRHFELALDPAWGEIQVVFVHDTIDDWNLNDQGSFVDDLRVVAYCDASVHCAGQPLSSGAPGATLSVAGSLSIASRDLRLIGAGFPLHTFAAAFAGPDPASFPVGIGQRCIGVGTSVRMGVAPTRDQGRPVWELDLLGAPLNQLVVAGQPLYVQTIFRDGPTLNLSAALRLVPCP